MGLNNLVHYTSPNGHRGRWGDFRGGLSALPCGRIGLFFRGDAALRSLRKVPDVPLNLAVHY